jgi:hypothetical protein
MEVLMKIKLLATAAILALSTTVYALPQKPEKCPSTSAIHDAGLGDDIIVQDNHGQWIVGLMSSEYDTPGVTWTFLVGNIDAADQEEAYNKAKDSLETIQFQKGPVPIQQISRWGCVYNNENNYIAIAVTPDLSGGMLQNVTHLLD